jgi:hypothetical protein
MTTPPTVEELAARLEELAGDVEQLHATLAAALDARRAEPGHRTGPAGRAEPARRTGPPDPAYATADAWIAGYFTHVYVRPVGGDLRWCRHWFEHAEAVIRLELLWRAWEVYRLRPLGAVDWHDILDRQLTVLLSDGGPFAACTPDRHEPSRPLPVEPTPPGWWDQPTPPATGAGATAALSGGDPEGETDR